MNPGPFSKSLISGHAPYMYLSLSYLDIKEHVAITIFSRTAAESALAINIFAADELFYNLEVSSSSINCSPSILFDLFFFFLSIKPKVGVGIFTLIGTLVHYLIL